MLISTAMSTLVPPPQSRPNTVGSTSQSLGDSIQNSGSTHSSRLHAAVSSDPPNVPQNGFHSATTSIIDFSRASSSYSGGSRPGTTAGYTASHKSSSRLRETFASPKSRQLTMYSSLQHPPPKIQRERPKSTMLSARGPVEKPWITSRDPYARIAYWLTYGVMLLGVAASVIRCWFSWRDTPMLPGNLCLVMHEDFDSADGIFGENGKFFREVDMSGFG